MSTTHNCIAEIFTQHLSPVACHDAESSVDRGHRAEAEAWSLRRLSARLIHRLQGIPMSRTTAELDVAVLRLSELSPHLLIDVGIDPATGEAIDEAAGYGVKRPVRVAELQHPVEDVVSTPVRKTARPRTQGWSLPALVKTAQPMSA
jgi:hypothetical protein